MSLILEALRKSEAERRRGQAPDLFAELPPAVRQRDARLSPVLGVVLAAMVLVGGAWLLRGMWSSSTQTDSAAIPAQPGTARSEPTQPSAPRPVASDPVQEPMPAVAAPAVAAPAVAAPSVASPVVDTPAAPAAAVPAGPTLPSASRSVQTGPRNNVNPPHATASSPASAPEPAERQTEPSRVPAAPVTTPTPASLPPPPPPTTSARPLKLTDLAVEQRKQLPPLRMSMHMWDQDPARRFVIIDGVRRAEGDRIGEAVVEQISADGVLLDWNGVRLRLSTR